MTKIKLSGVQKFTKIFFWVLFVISFILLVYQIYYLKLLEEVAVENTKKQLTEKVNLASKNLVEKFKDLENIVNKEKEYFNYRWDVDSFTLKRRLKKICKNNTFIHGIAVMYLQKDTINKKKNLISNYTRRKNGLIISSKIHYDYSINDSNSFWFYKILNKETKWISYRGRTSKKIISTFGIPFYKNKEDEKNKKTRGIIYANYSSDNIENIINKLDMGNLGYNIIISKEGKIIYHPTKEYVEDEKTLLDFPKNEGFKELNEILESKKQNSKEGMLSYNNNGKEDWIFYKTISNTNWTLISVYPTKDKNSREKRQQLLLVVLNLFFLFLSGISLFMKIHNNNNENMIWLYASFISMFLVFGIISNWYLTLKYPGSKATSENIVIVDKTSLNKFCKDINDKYKKVGIEENIFVPTGIYIQSFHFSDANDVSLTGYIWQKYKIDYPKKFKKEFIFPESISQKVKKAYSRIEGDFEIIGWYFETTLRQSFDYSKYPFDKKDVWVRLWHKDFDKNIVLTPDLDAYDFISPELQPGLDKDIVISDWSIQNSYFSYVVHNYSTNFGVSKFVGQNKSPELYFTLTVQRNFISPFISVILPFFVIIVLLFAMILNVKEDGTGGFLASSGGLLFTVLLAHFSLRESLNLKEVVYIENFYFVLYFAILTLVVTTFLYFSKKKIWLIDYNENFFVKVLFWPIILSILFVITLITYF